MEYISKSICKVLESDLGDLSFYQSYILLIQEPEHPFIPKSLCYRHKHRCKGRDYMVLIQVLEHSQIHFLKAICKSLQTIQEQFFLGFIKQIERSLGQMGD